ncbi:hypothetical protein D9M70_649910 [compost metagenome]
MQAERIDAALAGQQQAEPVAATHSEDGYWTPWHLAQAEIEALRKDKDRLDSGCIMTHERDEFGQAYKSERRGLDLRAAIDDAIHARQSQEVES